MKDTIYRQDAIDALKKEQAYYSSEDGAEIFYEYNHAIKALKNLPSAQPEIIQCRKCKFASGDSRICMKFGHSPIGELDFCAWAERRT